MTSSSHFNILCDPKVKRKQGCYGSSKQKGTRIVRKPKDERRRGVKWNLNSSKAKCRLLLFFCIIFSGHNFIDLFFLFGFIYSGSRQIDFLLKILENRGFPERGAQTNARKTIREAKQTGECAAAGCLFKWAVCACVLACACVCVCTCLFILFVHAWPSKSLGSRCGAPTQQRLNVKLSVSVQKRSLLGSLPTCFWLIC